MLQVHHTMRSRFEARGSVALPTRALAASLLVLVATALTSLSCGSDGSTNQPPPPPSGPVLKTLIGTGFAGLDSTITDPARTMLYLPMDMAFGPDGLPYIVDWNNHRILTIENNVVRRVIGSGVLGDAIEGPASMTGINHPTHVAFAPSGDIIMAAWHNSKVMRYDFVTHLLLRECGNGMRSFAGDGGPATADSVMVNLPSSTLFDSQGRMYISDQQNQRIRMVDEFGVIHTFAGTGVGGYSGDGGQATQAKIRSRGGQAAQPSGRIAMNAAGELFVADTGNNLVRKISGGIITTVAGDTTGARLGTNAGFSGDGGPATSAKLNSPSDIEIGPDGNLYIADTRNHCVRMVDQSGVITTIVGRGGNAGYDGEDLPATQSRLYQPYGIAFDAEGTLYVVDTHNHRVRYVK